MLEYRFRRESLTSHRARTLLDRVQVLEKAERNPDLGEGEIEVLRASLARDRGRALQQVAREAVLRADPQARGRLIAVARSRDVGVRARAGALLAAVAPARAKRIVGATQSDSTGRPPPVS